MALPYLREDFWGTNKLEWCITISIHIYTDSQLRGLLMCKYQIRHNILLWPYPTCAMVSGRAPGTAKAWHHRLPDLGCSAIRPMHFYQRATTIFRLSTAGAPSFFKGETSVTPAHHKETGINLFVVAQVVLAPRLSLLQLSEEPECGMVKSFQKFR